MVVTVGLSNLARGRFAWSIVIRVVAWCKQRAWESFFVGSFAGHSCGS